MPAVLPACAAILCLTKAWAATENLSIKLEYRIARGLKPIYAKRESVTWRVIYVSTQLSLRPNFPEALNLHPLGEMFCHLVRA